MNLMLENLNEKQKQAVETTEGPVLVLSGAGTGKTRVLTARVAYIMGRGLALPWQILALTFTNKAALEMKNRIEKLSDGSWVISDLWCGTFHSIALRILRFNWQAAGLQKDFLIFGEDDQKAVLKTVIKGLGLDIKEYAPSDWVEKISGVKDKGTDFTPTAKVQKIYNAYNREMMRMNAVDFGDIILKTSQLFNSHPEILQKYQNQFKYVLVDEFQDTNNAQHQFLKMLSAGSLNICCVGDDDQSIYSWRGAEIKHILGFERDYKDAKIIRLETNYRSTGNILSVANSLIKNNTQRLGKDLCPEKGAGAGEKVYVLTLPSDYDEARIVTQTISRKESNKNYSDFAVLIRAGSLSRLFEEELSSKSIPYRLVGATKFYDRQEIRDAIAYIRLLVHSFDDLSFLRIITKPRRGFGNAAIEKLRAVGGNLMDALRSVELAPRLREKADEFLSVFNFDYKGIRPEKATEQLLEDSGYLNFWKISKDPDAESRISNVRELISNVISKYENLEEFLEHAALMITDDDEYVHSGIDAVSIMTIHAAKGLEFDTVFLPAWEEGLFPNEMAIGEGSIEEERRLAYVAITRARSRCIIINVMARTVFGERKYNPPSRFIDEMDKSYINFQGGQKQVQTSYSKKSYSVPKIKKSSVGTLVSHGEMGVGVVIEDGDEILTVAFKSRGIKKVSRKFLKFTV